MKSKFIFPLLLSSLLLMGCAGETGNSSSSSSVADEDDRVMNRDDKTALDYSDVATPYTVRNKTNTAYKNYDYDDIYVNTPTNKLVNDFAFGVDCSSLYEVETAGGRFYDENGKEEDVFKILKAGGANYARFRLWVDPFDKDGNSYGGGINDISTDIYLAERAQTAGLKILIDFHYSDSWADPSKQWAPKAWMKLSSTGKPSVTERTQYKRVGDFTGKALNAFKNAGITVNAVQIGNETNNGMAGATSATSKFFADMISSGVATAKSVFPDVKTIVHLTNVTNPSSVYKVYDNLKDRDVDWDVCGLSYYPYWHGSRENLQTVMNKCAETYGKEVMIVETAWGYTDNGAEYCNNQYSTDKFGLAGGYVTSAQGQATELSDLVDCLSKVPNQKGTGLFYWEPAWLPLQGSDWVSKEGAFYNDYGYDASSSADLKDYTNSYCYSSWANQALFDYTGQALPSYKTYKYIVDGTKTVEVKNESAKATSFSATYNLGDGSDSIPESGYILTNVGSYLTTTIEWNKTEVDALKDKEQGHYTIHGKMGEYDVTCDVLVFMNYVQDSSFENQKTLQGSNANEYKVGSPWNLEASVDGVRVESKNEGNRTGTRYFHWWGASAFTFSLSQKLSDIPAGTYALSTYVLTHMATEYGGYNSISLWYQIGDGEKKAVSMLSNCKGYSTGLVEWSIGNIVVDKTSDVTIGMDADCGATTWGQNDDWSFARSA